MLKVTPSAPLSEVSHDQALFHYEDHTAFFYGKISAAAAALITFVLTLQIPILVMSLCLMGVMMLDVANIRAHKRLVEGKSSNFYRWEMQYTILSTFFTLFMGLWCFTCFVLSDDVFVHLLCVSITLGNILSMLCRNFSNERVLTMQLCTVTIPLVLGITSYGDFRSIILCAFFLPLFTSVRDISGRLRSLFFNIEQQSLEKETFGIQLNEALESMSHGLIMFDEDMRLRIINKTAREILCIGEEINCYSRQLHQIARLIDAQKPSVNRVRILEDSLTDRLRQHSADKVFKISDTQFVELSIKLRDQGGCVLVIEDVTQRINYQNRINQLARFDELTGLCNRSFFLQQSKTILQRSAGKNRCKIMFFDLDDFKRINDTMGHEAGDYILTCVADRAKKFMPQSTILGRYGGDEFVALVQEDDMVGPIERFAQRIIEDLSREVIFNNQVLRFGVSMGVASYPEDGTSIDRLLKLADLALYAAKDSGKNTFRTFSVEMEESLDDRIKLEDDLTKAVRDKSLSLHFQPLVNVETGKATVFEALIRWNRPGHGNVSPGVFVPIAEDLGIIRDIGEWTLMEACRVCMTWPDNTSVAVNLSAVQFQVSSVIEAVENALAETGLDPSRLEIEITETAVLNDMSHAIVVLEALCDLGVSISLDDFGTGYSSLSYLHKLPLNKLKIDKSFVDDITTSDRSKTLLKGITVLGRALDLSIVVEGIETQDQFDLLVDQYEIDYVQGYYFSKALPADQAKLYASREIMPAPTWSKREQEPSDETEFAVA
ncbi:MAG: EAL domain-containing protein [Pseudomonadota bacterium]